MKKMVLSLAMSFLCVTICRAQNVGIGTATPDASALLELSSTSKGFLPPQMNAQQKAAIIAPKKGLMIYQTDGVKGLYIFDGTAWAPPSGPAANAWLLTGNAGSSPAVNFIGTTDNQPLKFRVNNIPAGELNPVNDNTAFGKNTLMANSSGIQNVAIGSLCLNKNISGTGNIGLGGSSLFQNLSGNTNVALGLSALYSNKNGNDNFAAGYSALYSNISGYSNIAVGTNSLFNNVSGIHNVGIGDSALLNNTASGNLAIGSKAMYNNTTGSDNTAIGFGTLFLNNTTDYNTAIGSYALTNNNGSLNTANGYLALTANKAGNNNNAFGAFVLNKNINGDNNTAMGSGALSSNTSGQNNVAIGMESLYNNVIGDENVAIGYQALQNNTYGNENTTVGTNTMANNILGYRNVAFGNDALNFNKDGYQNTAIGVAALQLNAVGYNNTAIGYRAEVSGGNSINTTVIGANAKAKCNNCMILGSVFGVDYDGTATTNINVGIGSQNPQTDLHINPNGAGSILIGTDRNIGSYTNLEMGISAKYAGYSYIQSTQASGSLYGNLVLNQMGGNVGIRTAAPAAPLHIKESNETFPVNGGGLRIEREINTNHWDIGADAQDDLDFTFNGIIKTYLNNTTGGFTTLSDLRFKKDILLIDHVLPKLMQLRAKTYYYKDNQTGAKRSYGFIAQEVEKLFPDFVSTKGADSIKALAYQNFSVIAITAIQEQQVQIEELKKENELLMQNQQKMMLQFETRLKALEKK